MHRIVVFGATGYTGELTARALVRRGVRPLLAARSAARLEKLAADLGGLDIAVADVAEPRTVRALVEAGDVLVSTVGPFLRYGGPAVEAAVDAGAHYVDSTGEGPFIREVFERHGPRADARGVALLSGFGFDYVPGNLAGALALEGAPEATRVDVGYFVSNFGTSGGTRSSVARMMLEDGFGYTDGQIRVEAAAATRRVFEVDGRSLTGVTVPGSEHFGLPAVYPSLRDVGVHLGVPPALARGMGLSSILTLPARKVAPVGRVADRVLTRLVPGSTGGPDEQQRSRSRMTVVGEALAADGSRLNAVTLRGGDPYDFTAEILAWGATSIVGGGLRASGGLGPVGAFGLAALVEGALEAGLA